MNHSKWITTFCLTSALAFTSCGQDQQNGSGVTVAVQSTSGSTQTAALESAPQSTEPLFICVKSVTVEDETGENQEREVEFPIGLVDASQPKVDWGSVTLPVGFKISKIKAKVHKTKELCKVDYSIKYGTATSPQDVEFRWRFNPPIEISESVKTLELSFKDMLAHLAEAAQNGTISSLKDRVEELEPAAQAK